MEDILKALVLGTIQGLTEFLPISSTGHLLLGRKLLGLSEAGLFLDTMLHLGTLLAVVAVFWQDIVYMLKRPFSRLSLLIIVGTIPTAVIGLAFEDFFEEISKTGVTVGWEFLATGLILWAADNIKKRGSKSIDEISFKDAFIVGTLQGAAILPAISRSGLTIAGALFQGINKQAAARFSFLLSLPAILGAVVLQSVKLVGGHAESIGLLPLLAGTVAAALAGYVAVKWMLAIIQRGSLKVFSIYVWLLGIGVLTAQLLGKF
ncbi:undecaprenyl-diphosphate phosphatase [Desulforamulus hydrothermalis]|uniref:Undecaprenyl-diphosphatase n=1 Tax=Desulforamulus hydrothermalis Lam5 = DSM 18033 TaxID=1121428 RepID=K8DYX4_9FIRM|nr:undecaprenyl-diphosphate phosphatase [Desulforamulus hydrothermalis]CCO08177.1 Undecaprenyl-diphosphatase 4 [Desulforamulus hydrothermalis Lam5 = DSM 18033]SHH23118.1 undecaprenyl-diphosphatase [Desulforamulus hydrothermalis Lam5 = DSM 18033]